MAELGLTYLGNRENCPAGDWKAETQVCKIFLKRDHTDRLGERSQEKICGHFLWAPLEALGGSGGGQS